ncbi:flavin monoamine oxidase family protein [Cyclobacterium roseum]|uniref:flavin monoamine oxidase family protein n=1 Tax=Cyclobacterium roseum TaxID=2666137 RepID=UPI0013916167|nr:oleate hydratase [Cyclobacterium roseum]
MAHFKVNNLKHPEGHQVPKKAPVVIVGAGMAGLYTAWRLINEKGYSPEEIVILEKLNRTGGRLDSDLIQFEGATVKEEEGGMRFTFDSMDNLMALFMTLPTANESGEPNPGEELIARQIVPFPMQSGGNNRLYFRGVPFKQKEANSTWPQLYNLTEQEIALSPSEIINSVYNQILAANPDFTAKYPTAEDRKGPAYWQDFRIGCQWEGLTMKDWSLWNLFADMGYSNEAITMVYQSSGFNGTFLSQMNGGVAYQLLKEFPADPQFRTLSEGFSTLPNALAAQLSKKSIFLNTTVTSLNQSDEEGYTLDYTITNKHSQEEKRGQIQGAKVILALPRLALETLFIRSNTFNVLDKSKSDELWNTLQTATNQPLLKINLYYPKAWWYNETLVEKGALEFGPNFADLPVGSIYPFYAVDDALAAALEYQQYMKEHNQPIPEDIQQKVDEINQRKSQKPAALTIYCDYMNINYWLALQKNGPLFTSAMQEEENKKEHQVVFAASQKVVEKATEYFKKVFNVTYIPQPVLTSARIWAGSTVIDKEASERFGYGVHQWALHAEDDKTQELLTEPLPNVYTCNEAFSDYQGWVEGSLRSANLMLKKWGLNAYSDVFQEKTGKTPEEAVSSFYKKNSLEQIKTYIDPDFQEFKEIDPSKARENVRQSLKADGVSHGTALTHYDLP